MNQSDHSVDVHLTRINISTPMNSKNKYLQLNLKSVNSEKMNSPSSRAFYFGTCRSTANNGTFVPFVHERDGLGRLLNASHRIESQKSPKAKDTPVNFVQSPKGYKILENHSTLQISKRNKQNLNNILNMDTEMTEPGDISQAPITQLNGFFASPRQENFGSQTCRNHTQFKLNISASQKNMIQKKQTLLDLRIKNNPKERLSSSRLRPDPIFLSQSREEIGQLKARNISHYPNLGYYDTTKLDAVKPKQRNVLFGKAGSSRGEPVQKEESLMSMSQASERSHNIKIPGIDFTRQTSRDAKDNYWHKINSDKKVVDTKNLDEIEKDFQFTKQIKQKYDFHKIPYPHGAKLNPNSIPLEPHKLNETARGYMRLYNLIQGGPIKHINR